MGRLVLPVPAEVQRAESLGSLAGSPRPLRPQPAADRASPGTEPTALVLRSLPDGTGDHRLGDPSLIAETPVLRYSYVAPAGPVAYLLAGGTALR